MKRLIAALAIGVFGVTGCGRGEHAYRNSTPPYLADRLALHPPEDPLAGLASDPVSQPARMGAQTRASKLEPLSSPARSSVPPDHTAADQPQPKPAPNRLSIEGAFACSGWMGDAEHVDGPLAYEVSDNSPYRGPTCDKWTYAPPGDRSELRWIAVAYQGPQEYNWGQQRGVDLSGRNYTKLTFMARGSMGGERIFVRSGGCTRHDAPYPASYEATLGIIELQPSWRRYEIPLDGCNLFNVCSAFSFTINRSMAPRGCTFYLDEIAFE